MSKKEVRDFRPEYHFAAPFGWLNDPNGLVYENGNYHLFYQHYPFDTTWGPMHWGHAVSTDLLHWKNLPIALQPDELGFIFSGSAVYDEKNTSGFGENGNAPIVAMFTHHYHDITSHTFEKDHEQQSIAYSNDGVHFTKYESNPVLTSNELNFRDPKVFRHPNGGWGMVVAAGDHIEFYASDNLRKWEKTGEFGPEGNYSEGICECPDLFPLEINGETKWVLLISMTPNESNHGARVQYFIGSFDGKKFISDDCFTQPEFIDSGFDNYAAVTYDNTDERILIGWGDNVVYASQTPTNEFRCIMTIPRQLSLVDTPKGGVRLSSVSKANCLFTEGLPSDGSLPGEVFKLTVTGSGVSTVTLSNSVGQKFTFGVNDKNEAFVDRSNAGANDFSEVFASDWFSKISAPRFYDGEWKMELIFDHSSCELFLDNGTRVFSLVVFPDTPYTCVTAEGNAQVMVHKIK